MKHFGPDETDMENEDSNDELDSELPESIGRFRSEPGGKGEDKPVSNAGDIPFFHDADKRGTNTAAYLKIIKIAGDNPGYKGQLPLSSTEETIFQSFGDGTYNIELLNHRHKVLRTKENVKISLGAGGSVSRLENNSNSVSASDKHLAFMQQKLVANHERELERQERQTKTVTDQVTANAKSHSDIVVATVQAAAERERTFMSGMMKQNQEFFASMMAMQQNAFGQTMALLTAGHNMTMESLRATNEREATMNNPLLFMQVLRDGINMGREFDGPDKPEYLLALETGLSGLKELKELAFMKIAGELPANIPSVPNAPGVPSVVKQNPSTPTQTPPTKERILSKEELIEMARLKKILSRRGIDLESMLKQASEHYDKASDDEIFDNTSEESGENKDKVDDSNPTEPANVES